MELRHLRIFVALAEELHFGRTALRLHLTQPSVSGQLRQLEEHLGIQLIRRNGRPVSLTDAGVEFLRDARRILDQADAAANGIRRFRNGLPAGLRVGYMGDTIPQRLAPALRHTAHDFPDTRLVLSTGEHQKLLDDLRGGLLDVALVSLPAPVSGLRVLPLSFQSAVAAVPSNLDRDDTSPLKLLAQRPLLTLPRRRNPPFYDGLVSALHSAGLPGTLVEVEATSIEQLLLEVVSGAGNALVPESVVGRLHTPGVAFRRLEGAGAIGCRLAAVGADRDWAPPMAAFVARLRTPQPLGQPEGLPAESLAVARRKRGYRFVRDQAGCGGSAITRV